MLPALLGLLLGIVLLFVIQPLTSGGSWLLVILCVAVTVVATGVAGMCRRGCRAIRATP